MIRAHFPRAPRTEVRKAPPQTLVGYLCCGTYQMTDRGALGRPDAPPSHKQIPFIVPAEEEGEGERKKRRGGNHHPSPRHRENKRWPKNSTPHTGPQPKPKLTCALHSVVHFQQLNNSLSIRTYTIHTVESWLYHLIQYILRSYLMENHKNTRRPIDRREQLSVSSFWGELIISVLVERTQVGLSITVDDFLFLQSSPPSSPKEKKKPMIHI